MMRRSLSSTTLKAAGQVLPTSIPGSTAPRHFSVRSLFTTVVSGNTTDASPGHSRGHKISNDADSRSSAPDIPNTVAARWVFDPITGRFTNDSEDKNKNSTIIAPPENPDTPHVEFHERLPSTGPIITYQAAAPNYPIRYSCEGLLVGSKNEENQEEETSAVDDNDVGSRMVNLSIPITLEFLLPIGVDNNVDVSANVQALQWSLLQTVADKCGLSRGKCDLDRQFNKEDHAKTTVSSGNGNIRRRRILYERGPRTLQVAGLPFPTSVYAVGSNQSVDWTDSCSHRTLQYDESESQCITMVGTIDVLYRGRPEESDVVDDFIRSIFQTQMDLSPNALHVKDVAGIGLVPTDGYATSNPTDEPSTGTGDAPLLGGETPWVMIIPIATFAFVASVWLVVRLWSRRKNNHKGSKSNENLEPIDIEASCSALTETSLSPTESQQGNSWKSKSKPVGLDDDPNLTVEESSGLAKTISVPDANVGLPPRPPRRDSVNLKKKRRKKKKKKKVVALKRVNSRENIAEMPTISESCSEDDDSECDSEYTGEDDDGSSYDASSGYTTPVGSRSRSSSRASSPKLSPVPDESDVTFVIEAPDFPHLLEDAFAKNDLKKQKQDGGRNLPPLVPRERFDSVDEAMPPKENLVVVARERISSLEIDDNVSIDEEKKRSPTKRMFSLPWLKH